MTERREWSGEYRTKHALAVDRAIQAKAQHGSFNSKYKSAPNRGDVVRYDDKRKVRTQGVPKKPVRSEEYVPEGAEKERLTRIFHRLPPIQQHKDLLVTRNVARTESQVAAWEKNPRAGDIRGIDTQPESVMKGRYKVLGEVTGAKVRRKRMGLGIHGYYSSAPLVPESAGEIKINSFFYDAGNVPAKEWADKPVTKIALGHEFGHAYDRNVLGKLGRVRGGVREGAQYRVGNNVDFGVMKKPKSKLGWEHTEAVQRRKNWGAVERVTRKKLNPYEGGGVGDGGLHSVTVFNKDTGFVERERMSFKGYRQQDDELFADWFGGLVIRKGTVKRDTRGFYNVFKKANKPLFRKLKESDLAATKRFIGGEHKKRGGSWLW